MSPGCPLVQQYQQPLKTLWTSPGPSHGLWSEGKWGKKTKQEKWDNESINQTINQGMLFHVSFKTTCILLNVNSNVWRCKFYCVIRCKWSTLSASSFDPPAACGWHQRWSSVLWCACVTRCGCLCTGRACSSRQTPPSSHPGTCGSQTGSSSSGHPGMNTETRLRFTFSFFFSKKKKNVMFMHCSSVSCKRPGIFILSLLLI